MLAWTAEWLVQPDGSRAGDMWTYTPEQVRIVLRWYQIDEAGAFVHRRGVLRRMKGWGKDPFLASLAAVELMGPCRFGGWDAKGFPIAVPHPAPWIQVAAVSKDQTRNTMTLFPGLLPNRTISAFRVDPGKEIIYAGNGRIEAVTSSPRALEGGRPSLIIANETHHWIASNDGIAMADAIRRNAAKSRDGAARMMEITNAHLPDEGSVAEQTYLAAKTADYQLPGVYYDSVEAPLLTRTLPNNEQEIISLADIDDDTLRQLLEGCRGDSVWLNVPGLVQTIRDPVETEGQSRRFYLNQVTKQGSAWLPDGAWEQCMNVNANIAEHDKVVLAFDGSFSGDSTALVAVSIAEKPVVQVVECWEAPAEQPTWRVSVLDVEDAVRDACKRWDVHEISVDPYRWSRSMELLTEERLPVVEFPQSASRMAPATKRFYEAVVNNPHQLEHNGDARLRRHVSNCVLKTDSRGSRIMKETKNSPKKIDLAVCAVMGLDRAAALYAAGTGAPQIWSIREMVEQMRKEREANGNKP